MEQDELFLLIKALSKNEKKFFTRYANLYEDNGTPVYQKLFNFLNEEENYSEEKIFKKFREPGFKKNYPVIKHYLKQLIIKTLRHNELTVREDRDLTVYILDVKRLMAKGLFGMAKKLIEKLKEEAYVDEKFFDVLNLIGMQRSLVAMGYYRHEASVNSDVLDTEEEAVLESQLQLRHTMNASLKLYSMMHFELPVLPEEVVKQIKQLGKNKYLQDFDVLTSNKGRHTFLHFWTLYYCALGDYKKFREEARKKLVFVKSIKKKPTAAINWLIIAHNNYLSSEILTNNCVHFEEDLQYLEQFELKSSFHDSERFMAVAYYSLLYYIRYFNKEKLEKYIDYSLEGLNRLSPFIRKFEVYTLRTVIAYAYLKLKRTDECWKEVNELMALTNGETRKDYTGHVRLINLMLRYEMKEYKYVAYLLKSTYRFFTTYLHTSPVHKFMIGYLKEALKTKNEKELQELNANYLQILGNLRINPTEADMALMMMAENYLSSKV